MVSPTYSLHKISVHWGAKFYSDLFFLGGGLSIQSGKDSPWEDMEDFPGEDSEDSAKLLKYVDKRVINIFWPCMPYFVK